MKKFMLLGFRDFFSSQSLVFDSSRESSFKFDFTKDSLKEKGVSNQSRVKGISSLILLLLLFLFSNFLSAQVTVDGNPIEWGTAAVTGQPIYSYQSDPFGNGVVDNQFTNGSKDFMLAADQSWVIGQTKAKNDIANGAAVLIGTNLYFAGDRTSNNGDAQIGFWFYLNGTGPAPEGNFAPPHVVGDLLILANFTNGGRNALVTVYKWVGTGGDVPNTGGTLNTTNATGIIAQNNDAVFPIPVGWSFISPNYLTNEFYEGEVDLASLGLSNFCFASFLLEARSSQSITASLDDFVGGTFGAKPTVTVAPKTICAGESATLKATPIPAGTYTYAWSGPGGFTSDKQEITVSVAGDYSVIVTNSNGCSSSPGKGKLTVNPVTTATDLIPAIRCVGGADVVFNTTAGGTGSFTYVWKKGADIIVGATTNSYTVAGPITLAQAATYSVEVTGICGTVPKSALLTVNPNPTAAAGPDEAKCQTKPSGPTSFTLAGSATNGTIAWSEIAHTGDAVSTINTPTSLTSAVSVAGIGSVTLRLTTTSASCGTATDDVVITVNPNPTITCPDAATAPVLCGETQAKAQAQADIDFAAWFAQAPMSDADYLVTATYEYSSGATPAIIGTAPLILAFTNPAIISTSVTVTWTIKNRTTGCEDSCSSKWTIGYGCQIGCEITQVTNVKCNKDTNGSITVTAGNGSLPYIIYLYKLPDTTNSIADSGELNTEPGVYTFSNLAAGDYLTESTDAVVLKGDGSPCPATITEPDPLTCSVSKVKDATCNGDKNGSATVTPVGGNGGYTYLWDNGETTATATTLSAGLHSVSVTDSEGCTTSCEVTIVEPDPLTCSVSKVKDATCNGDKNGSATVTPVGGNGGYTYLWDNGETTATATTLSAGLHSVSVTDSEGCTTSCEVTIVEPDPLTCSVSKVKDATCNGDKNGSATVTPVGGNGGYTYLWDNGETTATATTLSAGLHSVSVTDSEGCTSSCEVTIVEPDPLTCSVSKVKDATCNGDKNGSATVTPVGGNGGYTYLWDNGETTATATTLSAGLHSVSVTDSEGCTTSCEVTIVEPDPLTCSVSKVKDATCNGDKNGSATVTPVGGNGGYTYLWDNGEITATATTLSAGLHSVSVTDSEGCTTSCEVTIGEPDPLTCSVSKVKDATCNGDKDGSATVTPVGGNGGYTYLWDNGETTATATTLSAGLHSVSVTDSEGCTTSCEVTIGEPDPLTCSVSKVKDATCNGDKNGSATVTPVGGNGGYTYLWDNGETTATATTLSAGLHSVSVTDSEGCTTSCEVTIGEPDPLTCSVSKVKDATCNGDKNGSATVTPVGGNGGYTYLWDNGETTATATTLSAGLHSVSVTDSEGCTTSCEVTIGEPDPLTCSVSKVKDATCNGDKDGSATVTPVGGNGGYTYLWDNGETTATATTLSAGLHSVSVTDSEGCTTSCEVTIGEPDPLTCSVSKVKDATCIDGKDGSATVTPVGGNVGFTYLWDNGETTLTAIALGIGLHSVTVTDSKGCNTSCEVTIDFIPCAKALCTYTQGYYGNVGGMSCAEGQRYTTTALITKALGYYGGTMVVGYGLNTVSVSTPSCVIAALPGGGGSYKLSGAKNICSLPSSYLKNRRINNTLLAQTITLGLNIGINSALGDFALKAGTLATAAPDGGCGTDIPKLRSCSAEGYMPVINEYKYYTMPAVVDLLPNKTVQGLYDMANKALGGEVLPAGISLSNLASAVDLINNAFDGCRISMGYEQKPLGCIASSPQEFVAFEVPIVNNQLTIKYKFSYVSDVTIDVFDTATGAKVFTKKDTNSYLGKEVKLDYNFNTGTQKVYIVRLTTRLGHDEQKVISSPY